MGKVYKFNSYSQQLEAVKNFDYENCGHEHVIFGNKQNNKVSFSTDLAKNREYVYDGENFNEDDYVHLDSIDSINEFNVMPKNVDKIEIKTKNHNKKIKTIKYDEYPTEEPLYSVGLVSDVHYNDTDKDEDPDTITEDGSEYTEDLKNALSFFESEGVNFVSCAGDISSDASDHLKNYKRCINKYAPNVSVFTCSGNHDTKPKFKYHSIWLDVMAINRNNEYEIHRFDDGEEYSKDLGDGEYDNFANDDFGTSFWFKKYYNINNSDNLNEDNFDVYIYLNLEYGHNDRNNYNTHGPRKLLEDELLVHDTVGADDYHLYHPGTLRYFANLLEEFKDHRCFIFTHIMFGDLAGSYHYGNGKPYYDYYRTHTDVMKGDQGEFCRNLFERYPNNYWFCGHSHYKWIWQTEEKYINVAHSGSYSIHLPSLARPLPLGIKGYAVAPLDAEGAIMEVYRDYVIIKGYVFKEGGMETYENKQSILATYKL